MNIKIPENLGIDNCNVKICYLSKCQFDRGKKMDDIVRERKPLAIFNFDTGKLTSLVDEIQVRFDHRDTLLQDAIYPLASIPFSNTHDIFFQDINNALSFLRTNYNIRLKKADYY